MKKFRVLHLEDNSNDAILVSSILEAEGLECEIDLTDKKIEFEKLLNANHYDIILSDYSLPNFSGAEALKIARKEKPDIPFIIISGTIGEDAAVQSLLNGATDYVLKHNMSRFIPSFYRALQRAEERKALKTAEESLKEAEERYISLFENNKAVMLLISPRTGEIVDANSSACKFYGYSKEQLLSIKMYDINTLPKDLWFKEINKITSSLNNNFFFKHILANGDIRDVEVFTGTIIVRNQELVYSIVHDVTDRKKAEEKLLKTRDFYLTLFEEFPTLIWRINPQGECDYVNNTFLNFTGRTLKEQLILGLDASFCIEDRENVNEKLSIFFSKREPFQFESKMIHYSGESRWILIFGRPFHDIDGAFGGFICAGYDITDRKNIEEELLKAKVKAEDANRLKSEFLAQMSHEIRTPINSLLNFAYLIKEEIKPYMNEDLETAFQVIDGNSHRLIRTIDLLLNVSQIQTGKLEVKKRKIKLNQEILAPLAVDFASSAKSRGIDLVFAYKDEALEIYADSYTVSQIFVNLIDNAIKFTKKGKVEIRAYRLLQKIAVEIADTGIGIASEYMHNLFSPFSQEEQGYTRKYEGNGLGLFLVKKYCEINKAEIGVKSKKGEGTIFSVSFNEV